LRWSERIERTMISPRAIVYNQACAVCCSSIYATRLHVFHNLQYEKRATQTTFAPKFPRLRRRHLYSEPDGGDRRAAVVSDVTALIQSVSGGEAAALQALFARVYAELKQMAHRQLAGSAGHTLNTTGLVHAVVPVCRPSRSMLLPASSITNWVRTTCCDWIER